MAFPTRLLDLKQKFGLEYSRCSRILKWTKGFIHTLHKHRVQNYLGWAMRYVEVSKLVFQKKKLSLSLTNPPQLAARTANVSVGIDGYRCGIARPVGRWENGLYGDVQATLWSGYKKVHNFLF